LNHNIESRVFIPQEPRRRDENGDFKPLYDLSPALKFGQLEVLLPHGPILLDTKLMVEGLRSKLANITERDYILLIGDPVACSIVVAIASKFTGGKLRLLKYDRAERLYGVVNFSV
jgi:hypothetical protein